MSVTPHGLHYRDQPSYHGFVERTTEADLYVSYQDKYRNRPKECERVALKLIRERANLDKPNSLLDIGCSIGNFIALLDRELAGDWRFTGLDLMPQAIEKARRRLEDERIEFNVGDMFTADLAEHDVITLMTVVYALSDTEFADCLRLCQESLKPGGHLIVFDLFHPWEASYQIVEKSHYHPDGHPLNMRPISYVRQVAEQTGLRVCEFRAFQMPYSLPKPIDAHDLTSYTVPTKDGTLVFRGPLSQQFCHAVFQK